MTIAETDRQLSSRVFTAPDKIIVATDLTDLDYLIPYAIAQCKACGASLVLSHVIPPVESGSLEAAVVLIADAARAAAQKLLHEAGRFLVKSPQRFVRLESIAKL